MTHGIKIWFNGSLWVVEQFGVFKASFPWRDAAQNFAWWLKVRGTRSLDFWRVPSEELEG